jgi:hypothetical protein
MYDFLTAARRKVTRGAVVFNLAVAALLALAYALALLAGLAALTVPAAVCAVPGAAAVLGVPFGLAAMAFALAAAVTPAALAVLWLAFGLCVHGLAEALAFALAFACLVGRWVVPLVVGLTALFALAGVVMAAPWPMVASVYAYAGGTMGFILGFAFGLSDLLGYYCGD